MMTQCPDHDRQKGTSKIKANELIRVENRFGAKKTTRWMCQYIQANRKFLLSILGRYIGLRFTLFKTKYTPRKGNFNTFFVKGFLN